MISVAPFLAAYDAGPDTLCSEPVLAYLRASGRVDGEIMQFRQRHLLRRYGVIRALAICGSALGFRLVRPTRLTEGDAVLLRAPEVDGGAICGLVGADGCALALAGDAMIGWTAPQVLLMAEFG
ncbi:hypothetical+protein [Methylocapsa aurea]|uniref:hypothetical protein n=1 Tax=Methylocapsa aurea TaxID=663610 RepID=UPI003D18D9E3